LTVEEKRRWIEEKHPRLSVKRQCELLDLDRSSFYYVARPENQFNLTLMRLLDEQYTKTPFYGVRRMTHWLKRKGHDVNMKRIRRLLREMGLESIYPKPHLSQGVAEHRKYPYLLKGVKIIRPNQVWGIDITYIRLVRGSAYLVAIMDWFSRYVLAWRLSISLELEFCLAVLEEALRCAIPDTLNSDQGSQFTSIPFTGRLEAAGVKISMDGRGRAFDNIFTERLWRSVKYEEVYLKDYDGVRDAESGLGKYFPFYNQERPHQALDYRTPVELYRERG
jgi:putative transposase